MLRRDSVPTALPDEETSRVETPPLGVASVSWQVVDNETVRVHLGGSSDADASDGVPMPLEAERSSTAAVVIYDLDVALAAVIALARRDRIPIDAIALRIDVDIPAGEYKEIALQVLDWRRFVAWYPNVMGEVERALFRTMDVRKATASVFRLRLLSDEIRRRQPPNGLNYTVLRIS